MNIPINSKAPMGFEPMNQGFADPAVRPLRHGAIHQRGRNIVILQQYATVLPTTSPDSHQKKYVL